MAGWRVATSFFQMKSHQRPEKVKTAMFALVWGMITIVGVAHCGTDSHERDSDSNFEGWKVVGDRLIGFYSQSATWQEAQNECERVGATLVIDDAPAINSHLNSLDNSLPIWLGSSSDNGEWFWSDGTPVDSKSDHFYVYDNDNPEDRCLRFVPDEQLTSWEDTSCSKKQEFACQKKINGGNGGTDISLKYVTSRLSWDEAQEYCAEHFGEGSSLVVVDSDRMKDLVAKERSALVWIDLRLRQDRKTWETSCHDTISYQAWDRGQPDPEWKKEDCVVQTERNKWHDFSCSTRMQFVCQITNHCHPSSCQNGGKCYETKCGFRCSCLDGFGGEFCEEKMVLKSEPNGPYISLKYVKSKLTWDEAQVYCAEHFGKGSSLVVVDSDRMRDLVAKERSALVWIGIHLRPDRKTWETSCQDAISYQAWDRGQPEADDCVVQTERNKWHDFPCETRMQFVCQITNHCRPSLCQNGGECHETKCGFRCSCLDGFEGKFCEKKIDLNELICDPTIPPPRLPMEGEAGATNGEDSAADGFKEARQSWVGDAVPSILYFRFNDPVVLSRIELAYTKGRQSPKTFDIVASDDCDSWKTLLTVDASKTGYPKDGWNIPCEKQKAHRNYGIKTRSTYEGGKTVAISGVKMYTPFDIPGWNIAKTANITVSSVYVWNKNTLARKETLTDGKIWDDGPTFYFDVCFHTGWKGTPWLNFDFGQPRHVNGIVIHNRIRTGACCAGRLFPFDIVVTDENGNEKQCQNKRFNVGDPEIPTERTIPIVIRCGDDFIGNSLKLTTYNTNKYLNVCEITIFGY